MDANTLLLLSRDLSSNSDNAISTIVLSTDKQSLQFLRVDESVTLTTEPLGINIYYTIDGSEPTTASTIYQQGNFFPNRIAPGKKIRAKAILPSGVASNELELRYLYPYLKTGQTTCYNFSTNVLEPCDATHTDQDGRLQKGVARQYSSPTTNTGFANDYITRDEVLGLTWTTCRMGQTGSTCSGSPTVVTGELTNPDDLCSQLNTANSGAGYAGIQNWRLPKPLELNTLSIYELTPIISFDNMAFPNLNTITDNLHSTRNLSTPNSRYYLRINQRFFGAQTDTTNRSVICVSGNSQPESTYKDLGDGTFRDELTGLIWTKCLAGQTFPDCTGSPVSRTFAESVDYCRNLNLSGKTWRLPNLNELTTLINPEETGTPKLHAKNLFSPLIDGTVLRSSTSESATSARRLTVNSPTNSGGGAAALKTNTTVHNICVTDETWQ